MNAGHQTRLGRSQHPSTISTVIPAYNAEAFLAEAVESALAQTWKQHEIIVVDDGSTDNTSNILSDFGDRIRVVRQLNRGRAAACNTGVAKSRGHWIAFLDADDLWLSQKLKQQISTIGTRPFSYTNSMFFGNDIESEYLKSSVTPQHSGRVLNHLVLGNFITGSSVLVKKSVFEGCGGFDESYGCVQDWPLWLKIAAEHEIAWVDEPLVRYRLHEGATTRKVESTLAAHLRVLDDAFRRGGPADKLCHLRRRAMASAYGTVGFSAELAGNWWFVAKCAARAMRYEPLNGHHFRQLAKGVLKGTGLVRT